MGWFVREYSHSLTEDDPEKPWLTIRVTTQMKLKLEDERNFFESAMRSGHATGTRSSLTPTARTSARRTALRTGDHCVAGRSTNPRLMKASAAARPSASSGSATTHRRLARVSATNAIRFSSACSVSI